MNHRSATVARLATAVASAVLVSLVAGQLVVQSATAAAARATITSATVTRVPVDAATASFQIDWTPGPIVSDTVKVFEGSSPTDTPNLLAKVPGDTTSFTTAPLSRLVRHYFRLVIGGMPRRGLIVSERGFPDVTPDINLRDLGGIPTKSGPIQWGTIFRSGAILASTSAANKSFIDGLGIKTVVDIRSPAEEAGRPRYVPPGATLVTAPIFDPNPTAFPFSPAALLCEPPPNPLNPNPAFSAACFDVQAAVYGENGELTRAFLDDFAGAGIWDPSILPADPEYGLRVNFRNAFTTLLGVLSDPANYPVVIFDSSGTFRMGLAAGLIERLIGVSPPAALEDFLLSNQFGGGVAAKQGPFNGFVAAGRLERRAMVDPLLVIEPAPFQAAENAVAALFGNWKTFARSALGMSTSEFRSIKDVLIG